MSTKNFSSIFPDNYRNAPTEAEILQTVKERLDSSENIPDDLMNWLREIKCPYMREACAAALKEEWCTRERDFESCTGIRCDGCWYPYWPNYRESLLRIIEKSRKEQQELEQAVEEQKAAEQAAPAREKTATERLTQSIRRQVEIARQQTVQINIYGGSQQIFAN